MEKPNNVVIIAIEGPDKVGKETQSKLLEQKLDSLCLTAPDLPVVVKRFEIPSSKANCYKEIYQMLDGGTDAPAKKWAEVFQAFHAANRLDVQNQILRMAKGSGTRTPPNNFVIIFDRWHASSFAYGAPLGVEVGLLRFFRDLMWTPDLTVLLQGNGFTRDGPRDAYEDDSPFQKKVRDAYNQWCVDAKEREESVAVVNADQEKETVRQAIMYLVAEKLNQKGWRRNA